LSGYFTNTRAEQEIEQMMRSTPTPLPRGKSKKVFIKRCENCSSYDKANEKCRLSRCPFAQDKQSACEDCPYRNGICNICYKELGKGK